MLTVMLIVVWLAQIGLARTGLDDVEWFEQVPSCHDFPRMLIR